MSPFECSTMPKVATDLTINQGVEPLREFLLQAAMQGLFSSRPIGWTATTVGDVCELATGATPDSKRPEYYGGPIKWLRSGDINQRVIFDCEGRITEEGLRNSNCKILPADSVLIALNGQGKTRGSVAMLRTEAACNQSLVAIVPRERDRVAPEFVYWSLRSRYRAIRGLTGKEGDRRGLNMRLVGSLPITFPTAPEQHRIVSTIDALMGLCDEFEVAQSHRDETRDRLRAASLTRLTAAAATPGRVAQKDVTFFLSHSDRTVTKPEHVADLRRFVLDVAVLGRLSTSNPEDVSVAPAMEALRLPNGYVRRRKIVKRRPTSASIDAPHHNWVVRTVQDLYDRNAVIDFADGNHGSLYPRASEFSDAGVLFVTAKDLYRGRVAWGSCAHLSEDRAARLMKGWSEGGDVLLTHNATVGRVARVEPDVTRFLLGTSVTYYRLHPAVLSADYFYYYLLSNTWQRQMTAIMEQTTRNQVSIQKQAHFWVLLPPLPEQKRIASKIDELMLICDRLEQALLSAQEGRAKLLEAVLHEALDPQTSGTELAEATA